MDIVVSKFEALKILEEYTSTVSAYRVALFSNAVNVQRNTPLSAFLRDLPVTPVDAALGAPEELLISDSPGSGHVRFPVAEFQVTSDSPLSLVRGYVVFPVGTEYAYAWLFDEPIPCSPAGRLIQVRPEFLLHSLAPVS